VIKKVGLEVGKQVIECRARNHEIIKKLGGRGIHPVAGVPGGWSKSVSEEERKEIEEAARKNLDFALFSLKVFDSVVLSNSAYLDLVLSDVYHHRTYYMGTVDPQNRVNFYDGMIRVVDPEGHEFLKYRPAEYTEHIAEHVESWSYLKFPYLRKLGWKGFVDGPDSGVYCATPLSRLNVSDRLATARAQQEFDRFYTTFGRKKVNGRYQPVHHRLATHWARLIELLYAAERMLELALDPEITSPNVRAIPQRVAGVGVGSVEAPRGTLIHHYTSDEKGIIKTANLVVGTTNNYAAIAMSIRKAAEKLINGGRVVEEGLLNRIEMAFRLYDPCMSCATHSLPGAMPLIVNLRNSQGALLQAFRRDG
jgi:F420-non-reducing hydrogenase large subunit